MLCPQIIYAAKSRSTYNVELKKVEETGPFNLAKAFMVSALAHQWQAVVVCHCANYRFTSPKVKYTHALFCRHICPGCIVYTIPCFFKEMVQGQIRCQHGCCTFDCTLVSTKTFSSTACVSEQPVYIADDSVLMYHRMSRTGRHRKTICCQLLQSVV